jgi:crotonobetainyl-CoA:carnitine CoA-transferase CaiB-like acyl-CoA transferase
MESETQPFPLDGLKVIDAGLLVQGPQAALQLHDWGADVVKVELPGLGDQSRWLPAQPGDTRSAFFTGCNRGKRSVTVDLRVPAGRDLFLRLAADVDVVISNFAPGTMEAWGLAYEDVAAVNPRIVYAVGSTFGHRGPDAPREGADLAAQAAGGLIASTGRAGEDVTPVAITIADHISCQNLVAGILAALLVRERTGRGQRVETSLLGGQVWAQASEITGHLLTGRPHGRANRGHPLIPGAYAIFSTADGAIAIVGVVGPLRQRFYELIGRPELAERFDQPLYWDEEKTELFPLVDEAMRAKTTAEWAAVLAEAGIRHAPVRGIEDVVEDPQVWANDYLVEVDGERVVASPVRFSESATRTSASVPEVGQHTEEVLLEHGLSWDDIAALQAAGAI